MDDKTQKILSKIQELDKKRKLIEEELKMLLYPEKKSPIPYDFSIADEVFAVIKESGGKGIEIPAILKTITSQYPDYGIDRTKIASALAYLKNTKEKIEQIDRGIYRAVEAEIPITTEGNQAT